LVAVASVMLKARFFGTGAEHLGSTRSQANGQVA
jgi:hypothetical protein